MTHPLYSRTSRPGLEITGARGGYTLEKRLDGPDKNRVYLARRERDGAKVVAKWYPTKKPYSKLFAREAAILSILGAKQGHDHVLTAFELAMHASGNYIITPHLEGTTLRKVHAHLYAWDSAEVAAIMGGVFEGIDFMHKRGVVHRDIKTENIYLCCDEEIDGIVITSGRVTPTVFDFDLAMHPCLGFTEQQGTFVGSYEYASPEVWHGLGADERSDIYSLGCLVYELFTGGTPFGEASIRNGKESISAHFSRQHTSVAPEDPRIRSAYVSDRMARTILNALRKDPADRYPTTRHFRDAFFDAL